MKSRFMTAAFYGLFCIFLVWYLRRVDLSVLGGTTIDMKFLLAATVLALGYRYWGVLAWLAILRRLGARPKDYRLLAFVYAKSWLGRYLPGKITWVLGKIYFASEHGLPRRKLAISAVIETGLQVAVTLLLSVLALSIDSRLNVFDREQVILLIVSIAAFVVLLSPPVFNWFTSAAARRLREVSLDREDLATTGMIMSGVALYSASFLLTGVSYFLFCKAFAPDLRANELLYVIGTFNLAGALGILSIFAPSGLGVREGVQLVLLPAVMSAELALAVTVAARIWSVGVDLTFYGVTRAFRRPS